MNMMQILTMGGEVGGGGVIMQTNAIFVVVAAVWATLAGKQRVRRDHLNSPQGSRSVNFFNKDAPGEASSSEHNIQHAVI